MIGKLFFKLPIIRRCRFTTKLNSADALKWSIKREYGKSSTLYAETNSALPVDEQLQEIFKFRDTKISNWIIEVSITNYILYVIKCNLNNFKSMLKNICRTRHVHYVSDILKAIRRIASEFCAYWLHNMLCNMIIYVK